MAYIEIIRKKGKVVDAKVVKGGEIVLKTTAEGYYQLVDGKVVAEYGPQDLVEVDD